MREATERKTVLFNFRSDRITYIMVEPYGVGEEVAKGDTVELTYTPDEPDTIEIADEILVVWCSAPTLKKNGELVIDFQ